MSSYLSDEEQREITRIQRELELSQPAPAQPTPRPDLSLVGAQLIQGHQNILEELHGRLGAAAENTEMPQEAWEAGLDQLETSMMAESGELITSATNTVRGMVREYPAPERVPTISAWRRITDGFMGFWRKALEWVKELLVGLVDRACNMWKRVKECFKKVGENLVRLWRGAICF